MPSWIASAKYMINMPVPIISDKNKVAPGANNIPNFNATILVVEDNHANQQVAQAMLERLGCKCSIAGNGIEALKWIAICPRWMVTRLHPRCVS